MPPKKLMKNLKIAVICPSYKRDEYTSKCLKSLEDLPQDFDIDYYLVDDCSQDDTWNILSNFKHDPILTKHGINIGLRRTVIEFFDRVRGKYDILAKVDNDCVVPRNWLSRPVEIFNECDVDILSPNVIPSDASNKCGHKVHGLPYTPSKIVGGLWIMKASLIDNMVFEGYDTYGLKGAFQLFRQIVLFNDAKVGWMEDVTVNDIGHYSGTHPEHIKSEEHFKYSIELGRTIAWA